MRRDPFLRGAIVAVLVALAGASGACSSTSSSSSSSGGDPSQNTTVSRAIGPAGGTIEVAGAVVTFPKGAVASEMQITIGTVDEGPPEGYVALSKMFICLPSGTDFAVPVEMRMPFVDDGKGATMLWSSGSDPTFKDLGGQSDGKIMVATIQHFSRGMVVHKK